MEGGRAACQKGTSFVRIAPLKVFNMWTFCFLRRSLLHIVNLQTSWISILYCLLEVYRLLNLIISWAIICLYLITSVHSLHFFLSCEDPFGNLDFSIILGLMEGYCVISSFLLIYFNCLKCINCGQLLLTNIWFHALPILIQLWLRTPPPSSIKEQCFRFDKLVTYTVQIYFIQKRKNGVLLIWQAYFTYLE